MVRLVKQNNQHLLTMQSNLLISKKTRLADLIHYRLKVVTLDGRTIIGELLAFDSYMNLVLADAEEFRLTKKSKYAIIDAKRSGALNTSDLVKEDKRVLGLIILRGVNVVGTSIESAPATSTSIRLGLSKKVPSGSGIVKPLNNSQKDKQLASALRAPIKTTRTFQPPPGFKRS